METMATKAASASLEERLKANPDSLSFSRVAEYFRTSGDIARAIDICVRGNLKHPEYVTGRIVLGRCYADLDNFDEAIKALTSVCMIDRRNMVAMKMLADMFLRLGSRGKAGDLYAHLASMDPWNETISRLAAQTPGSRNADVLAILDLSLLETLPGPSVALIPPMEVVEIATKETPVEEPPGVMDDVLNTSEDTLPEAIRDTLPQTVAATGPAAEADAAAQKAVTQEVERADLGITEVIPEEKDEGIPETSENIPVSGEEALFEATTVTGSDITDRMTQLFGEMPALETREESPRHDREPSAPAFEDTVETIEVQPMDAIPDGNTISSRIDELFNRDTLKMPAIKEAALSDAIPAGNKDSGVLDEIEATIVHQGEPAPSGEVEFEETMIMDAVEVKEFLKQDLREPDPVAAATGSDESGSSKGEPDLIADAVRPAIEAVSQDELIVDEKEPARRGPGAGPFAALGVDNSTVTGDDVVRLMTGFFEGGEDKALFEVVGPETIDDLFEGTDTDLVAEPLPAEKGHGEPGAIAAPVEEKPSLVTEEFQAEPGALPALDDTITGDDVAKRIDGYFGRTAPGPEDASSGVDDPAFPEPAAPLVSLTEDSSGEATIVEGIAGASDRSLDLKDREGAEELTLTVDDTRVVEAGRPPETDVIEDTVAEGAGGIISGADVEERLEEYFHDAAEKTARNKEGLSSLPLADEEATYPDFPQESGNAIDKKADYEETIIASDEVFVDIPFGASIGDETTSAEPLSLDTAPEEESIVETVGSMDETLDARDHADGGDAPVPEKIEDRESTAVFTEFGETSVFDAPPVPPEVPLFNVENPRALVEETIGDEVVPSVQESVESDIPDHVLTPTLADIYLQQGQPKLALTIYQRLLEKNPGNGKLEARVKEIEKTLAEGAVPVAQVEQKPTVVVPRKKPAAKTAAQRPRSEDTRPLAGVRLKKKPKLNWKKNKNV